MCLAPMSVDLGFRWPGADISLFAGVIVCPRDEWGVFAVVEMFSTFGAFFVWEVCTSVVGVVVCDVICGSFGRSIRGGNCSVVAVGVAGWVLVGSAMGRVGATYVGSTIRVMSELGPVCALGRTQERRRSLFLCKENLPILVLGLVNVLGSHGDGVWFASELPLLESEWSRLPLDE